MAHVMVAEVRPSITTASTILLSEIMTVAVVRMQTQELTQVQTLTEPTLVMTDIMQRQEEMVVTTHLSIIHQITLVATLQVTIPIMLVHVEMVVMSQVIVAQPELTITAVHQTALPVHQVVASIREEAVAQEVLIAGQEVRHLILTTQAGVPQAVVQVAAVAQAAVVVVLVAVAAVVAVVAVDQDNLALCNK